MINRFTICTALCGLVLAAAGATGADDLAAARFHGAPTYDFEVKNWKFEPGDSNSGFVTFDLFWSYSWRAKWTEPAATSCNGKDIEVENWDAAWVFIKFLPDKGSKEAIERNHWRHATLAADPAAHVMPAGATHSVKLSDDGSRGMGVFIYRNALGQGTNNWKGIKLRWLHGPDKVDPAKAAIQVHAIAMVYIPTGPYMIGFNGESGVMPYADGPDFPVVQLNGNFDTKIRGSLTDGAWRGGAVVPFLLDAAWNAPAADNPRARRVGIRAGQLWSTLTYYERAGDAFPLRFTGHVNDEFPSGYDAFYCMKYPMTQGQYVEFLNSLPPDVAAGRAFVCDETSSDASMHKRDVTINPGPEYFPFLAREVGGNTITSSADYAKKPKDDVGGAGSEDGQDVILDSLISGIVSHESQYTRPPVYRARCPFRRLAGVSERDARAFGVWAGLRPATSIEEWKVDIGSRHPAAPPGPASTYDRSGGPRIVDEGLPNERVIGGKCRAAAGGNDFGARVGFLATPTSDQAAAQAGYWGVSEPCLYPTVAVAERKFCGSHGDGRMPAGSPAGSLKRRHDPVTNMPADWPDSGGYCGNGRHVYKYCWLVVSADNRIHKSPAKSDDQEPTASGAKPQSRWDGKPPAADTVKISNVEWTAGTKDYSTVSFDLAWDRSWRAKWTEPADKNVTGKPLEIESWDAAWVFVKYRLPGQSDESHATLAAEAANHGKPDGATLDVGLDNDGETGVGVFLHRTGAGKGPVAFKNVRLRWVHGAGVVPGKDVQVRVYAIEMVYVPTGPFKVKSPWGHPMAAITQADPTKAGGKLDTGPDSKPESSLYPNGYAAFYIMKHSISQGQYADLLNSQASDYSKVIYNKSRYAVLGLGTPWRFSDAFYGRNGFTIKRTAETGRYAADKPGRHCMMLSVPDIQSFTAWAGLRPPTALEYEKACRGPREVRSDKDAWTPQTCAPADGIDQAVLGDPPPFGPGPSYWGILGLSQSGCIQEWPAVARLGIQFRGSHGTGSVSIPEDWPWNAIGEGFAMGSYQGFNKVGIWFDERELAWAAGVWPNLVDADRTGRYGARAARTAAIQRDPNAVLHLDRVPDLRNCEVGIFDLSGRFRNDGSKAVNIAVATPLPDVCFPGGAASLTFTAAPKGITPFKIPMVLTPALAAGAAGEAGLLPLRLLGPGGAELAETQARLQTDLPGRGPTPTIPAFDGGELNVRVMNVSDRAQTVKVTLAPPAGLEVKPTERQSEIAAGANSVLAFAVPPQGFTTSGVCGIPYRAVVGACGPFEGRFAANLQVQRRWWIGYRRSTGPKIDADEAADEVEGLGLNELVPDGVAVAGVPKDLFSIAKPPAKWITTVSGETLSFDDAFPRDVKQVAAGIEEREDQRAARTALAPRSSLLGATRIHAQAERKVRIAVKLEMSEGSVFRVRVWVNETPAYDEMMGRIKTAKAVAPVVTLRKGQNTLLVECLSEIDKPTNAQALTLSILDAADGKPAAGVVFDIEKR